MVLCPVEDIRGQAGTGSVLSLDAIGKQDQFLLGDNSFFNYNSKRHTNFQIYQTITNVVSSSAQTPNWPFDGSTVNVTLYPKQMGDLLTHMYLQCTLPRLQDVGTPGNPGQFPGSRYCPNVGRAIINSIKFRVDQYEVETLYDDWMHIHDSLYQTIEQRNASRELTDGVGDLVSGPIDLYIPLPFFFSSEGGSFFPLCAIANQKITLEINFNRVNFLSNTRIENVNPRYNLGLESFNIVCEQIAISDEERLSFKKSGYRLLARASQRQPEVQSKSNEEIVKINLVMNAPVESIHWVLRQTLFESDDVPGITNYFMNRYNYSNTSSTDELVQAVNPIMSDVTVFINNKSELGFFADNTNIDPGRSIYYKYAEPLASNLTSPLDNIYTYTFGLNVMNNALSGAINFSKVSAQTTFLNIKILKGAYNNPISNTFSVQTFYSTLRDLKFSGGFMTF
jgi:hypothetical protein